MIIRIKLMGMLKEKTPESGELDMPQDSTIKSVLEALDIPVDSVQVFTVNGSLEQDKGRVLADHDELTVLPPVGGG